MSAVANTKKIAVSLRLDNGTTASGEVKTIGQTLGTINKDAMDIDKAFAIALAAAPCLAKSIYAVEQTVVSSITNAE